MNNMHQTIKYVLKKHAWLELNEKQHARAAASLQDALGRMEIVLHLVSREKWLRRRVRVCFVIRWRNSGVEGLENVESKVWKIECWVWWELYPIHWHPLTVSKLKPWKFLTSLFLKAFITMEFQQLFSS